MRTRQSDCHLSLDFTHCHEADLANYFIVFELSMPYQATEIESVLCRLHTPVLRVLPTAWYVNSPLSIEELYSVVGKVALPTDRFILIDALACDFDNLLVGRDAIDGNWDRSLSRARL